MRLGCQHGGARTELTRIECLLGNLAPLGATLAEADTHLAAEVVEHETAITALVGADTDYAKMAERHRSEANTINARLAELADARTSIDEISRVLSPLVNNPVRAVSVDFNAAVASEYGNSCTYTTASEPWRHMVHKVSLRGSHVFVDRRLFTGPAVNCIADVPSATVHRLAFSTEMNGTQSACAMASHHGQRLPRASSRVQRLPRVLQLDLGNPIAPSPTKRNISMVPIDIDVVASRSPVLPQFTTTGAMASKASALPHPTSFNLPTAAPRESDFPACAPDHRCGAEPRVCGGPSRLPRRKAAAPTEVPVAGVIIF